MLQQKFNFQTIFTRFKINFPTISHDGETLEQVAEWGW